MTTDFGTDLACVDDLDPALALVTGRRALAEAIARRLSTARGALFYDRSYGYDLPALLNDARSLADLPAIRAAIVAQAMLDERVDAASARVTFDGATLRVRVALETAGGPFDFVLAVSSVTTTLLEMNDS